MKVFKTTFLKKNGEERVIKFVEVKDLPKGVYEFKGKKKLLKEEGGDTIDVLKVVWDVEVDGFRILDTSCLLEKIKEIDDFLDYEQIQNKYNKKKQKENIFKKWGGVLERLGK